MPAIADMTAQELLDERNTMHHRMRQIKATADSEKRDFNAAETDEWEKLEVKFNEYNDAFKAKKKSADRAALLEEREALLDERASERKTSPNLRGIEREEARSAIWTPGESRKTNNRRMMNYSDVRGSKDYTKAYQRYLRTGDLNAFSNFKPNDYTPQKTEQSALQADDDIRGGYTVVSETFAEGLLRNVDDETLIYNLSRVLIVSQAQSTGIRKLTTKARSWAKGSEVSDAWNNEENSLAFGKKVLTPSYYTGAIRVSRDLIRTSVMDIEALVYSEMARDLAELIEQENITGNGNGGPLGVLVASNDGISTARDFSSDTTSSTYKYETILGAKYFLKQKYRKSARWMFHRNRIAALAKLRSDSGAGAGTGDFLWQPAIRAGEPDTLSGIPLDENEWFPSGTGSGTYFGILANWEYYVHAVALDMELLRLDQTRAHKNQIEYVCRFKIDGMPILEEPFVRLKFA